MALYNNARWEFAFNLQDEAGVPQDLTGRSFAMWAKRQLRSSTVDLQLSTAAGSLLIGENAGELQVYAVYNLIKDLKQGTYYFDIVELLGEDQVMVASGELYVKSGITQT